VIVAFRKTLEPRISQAWSTFHLGVTMTTGRGNLTSSVLAGKHAQVIICLPKSPLSVVPFEQKIERRFLQPIAIPFLCIAKKSGQGTEPILTPGIC